MTPPTSFAKPTSTFDPRVPVPPLEGPKPAAPVEPQVIDLDEPEDAPAGDAPKPTAQTSADARAAARSDLRALYAQSNLQRKLDQDAPSPAMLQSDKRYERLPADTKKQVQAQLDGAKDGDSRINVSQLSVGDGFSKLSAADQKQMLDTLGKNPSNREYGNALHGLAESQNFAKLDPETRRQVLDGIGKSGDPKAAANYRDLADSEGFGKLGKAHQKEALDTLGKNPSNEKLASDVKELAGKDEFRKLSDETQSKAFDKMQKYPDVEGWAQRKAISDISTSPGFAGLNQKEQNKLLDLTGNKNAQVSDYAKTDLWVKMQGDGYKNASAADQTKQLRAYMNNQEYAPASAHSPENFYDDKRVPYKLTGPKDVGKKGFQTGFADAQTYDMEVDGRHIEIQAPKNPNPKNGNYVPAEDIAKGISALPKESRDRVQRVVIQKDGNADDAYWRSKPGYGKDHSSWMTCGADGKVSVYPSGSTSSQHQIDSALQHEVGHAISGKAWGSDTNGKAWDEWKAAIKSDNTVASKYAKASPAEDFSETLVLYNQVHGKHPDEEELRALMPERFRLMDRVLASGK
jgi:hypothetical protein